MPPLVLAQLIAGYGIPLAQQIYTWVSEKKQSVSPEEFAALLELGKYRSSDSLAAASIRIVDGKVVSA